MMDAARADEVLASGGVVLFGADTVYGLACAHDNAEPIARIVALKGRAPDKPNALLAFNLEAAEPVLSPLDAVTRHAATALLPGPVTLVLPGGTGLRVPALVPAAEPLAGISTLVTQTSANLSGEPSPCSLADVAPEITEGVDLVLDAGTLPGTASTVVDLRNYAESGSWSVIRPGARSLQELSDVLGAPV